MQIRPDAMLLPLAGRGNISLRFAQPAGGVAIQVSQQLLITGGAFTGNLTGSGGGLWFNGVKGTIQGVKITSNAATQTGGGVKTDFDASTLILKTDILSGNTAPDGPDVANFSGTITFA